MIVSAVKRALHRAGFDLIRYTPPFDRPFEVLPLVVRERLALDPHFFFVQIGANDGVYADPLRDLILRHNLAGVLVEPVPEAFAALVANYIGCHRLRFENVAIGASEGTLPLYRVRPGTEGPRFWFDIASFDRTVLTRHAVPEVYIEALPVPTITLSALLAKHDVKRLDLLQIDAEGHDGIIVREALALGVTPRIINYESIHLPPAERYAVKRLLAEHGYRFIDVERDTLALRTVASE
jgi:FkbM family methyltransferase